MRLLRALTRGSGWLGLVGGLLLLVLLLLALFGPFLDLPDPTRTNLRARMQAPTLSWHGIGAFPLGTDQLGRDILSRIVAGSRVTLMVAAAAVVLFLFWVGRHGQVNLSACQSLPMGRAFRSSSDAKPYSYTMTF